jgi:pimeloyl-ACP methyl ester carboxylesterase
MAEHRWVANGDVRVHYLDVAGSGPAVVFVPGFGESADEYAWLAGSLGPRHTVVVDLRGRGRSDVPDKGYDLEDHLGDLDAVLSDAGVERAHVVCYSRGTAYGLGWALEHPARVVSVVVGDYLAHHPRIPADYVDRFLASTWRGRPVTDRLSPVAAHGILREATTVSYWERLGSIPAPVLVMHGMRPGALLTDDGLARWRAHRPDVRTVAFEESGHDLFSPDRERFVSTLSGFIAEVEGS